MKCHDLFLLFSLAVVRMACAQQPIKEETGRHCLQASYGMLPVNSAFSNNAEKKDTGSFALTYLFHANEWVAFGADFAYSHAWFSAMADPELAYPKNDNSFVVAGHCDVLWFRRQFVRMYSGLALGVDVRVQESYRGRFVNPHSACHLTCCGVAADYKKAFGKFELGYGCLGCVRMAIGCKIK